MSLPRWALPEHIEDVLPIEAQTLETLRRRLLDEFRLHGYQLVMPPLIEHLDSLASGVGQDMVSHTFRLVDQISGRTLGLRADITPQVTRIDAHLLNRRGVARLCYCGSVVHTLPRSLTASREPLQLGAELYGHAGLEADIEIVRLLAHTLNCAEVGTTRIDLGHVGLFRAITRLGEVDAELEQELFAVLQAKDVPTLRELVVTMAEPARSALLSLTELYGDAEVLGRAARQLPADTEIQAAIAQLAQIAGALTELTLSFDLSDLRGYHYHSGLVFAAYGRGSPSALALGGRYDQVGHAFGRARPATGFSLDLRELVTRVAPAPVAGAILAPDSQDAMLADRVVGLRRAGEVVMVALPGHEASWAEAGCDRILVRRDGAWVVEPLQGVE